MLTWGLPALYTLLVWWFSTGAVLYVIGRPKRSYPSSMMWASAVALATLYALHVTSGERSIASAFIAFSAALGLWGWHEMSFLTGWITGPRTTALPKGTTGSARLLPAIEAVIYHELALFLTLAVLAFALYGSANETGLWTFALLWIMRLSTKLNLYLGVSNITEAFLPDHLKYLSSYFRHRPMNLLFPVSVSLTTLVLAWLVWAAGASGASDFEAASYTFLATLTALALLEHWFLVLPLRVEELWSWGLASRQPEADKSQPLASDPAESKPVALAT